MHNEQQSLVHEHKAFQAEMRKANHSCTDMICCLVFMVTLCVFACVYGYALADGNIDRLHAGIGTVDGQSVFCGLEPAEGKPYAYWCSVGGAASIAGGAPPAINLASPVCVADCPHFNLSNPNAIVPECTGAATNASGTWSYAYATQTMGSYCMPDPNVPGMEWFADNISSEYLNDYHKDAMEMLAGIPKAWPVFVGVWLLALVLGFVYLLALRCCAEMLIWASFALGILGSLGLGFYLWANAGTLSESVGDPTDVSSQLPEASTENEEQFTKGLAIACWVLCGVLCCVLCFFHSSIKLAARVSEVACECIHEMPTLLILPLFKAIIKLSAFAFLLYGFLTLWTVGELVTLGDGITRTFSHTWGDWGIIVFFMFASFWILAFMDAAYQFTIAYAVGEYYYTPPEHDGYREVHYCSGILDGLQLALTKHSGSLAMGSALVAILQTIQKIIEYAEKKNKEGPDNAVVSCILCCIVCCVKCCKDVIEAINKNAYIDIAITIPSPDFCRAAQNVFKMIAELGGAMAILNGATFVFTVFGTLTITLASGAFAYMMIHSSSMFTDESSEYHVDSGSLIVVVSMGIAFLVALAFMNIFDMTSDTLLYCYGHDLNQRNGGHTAPPALKELFHEEHSKPIGMDKH